MILYYDLFWWKGFIIGFIMFIGFLFFLLVDLLLLLLDVVGFLKIRMFC